jgi:hypothetical protein
VGGSADVAARVVQHKVLEMHELAFEPERGAGVGEVGARHPPLPDRAFGEALVEPCQCVLRGGQRAGELCPGQRVGDVIIVQVLDKV